MSTSIPSATACASSSTAESGGVSRGPAHRPGPDPVRWAATLFILNILLQRISLPGISIPLTVPVTVLWCLAAWRYGVLVLERRRAVMWMAAGAVSSLVVLPQVLVLDRPFISANSWLFWMTMWFPVVFMMAERSGETYRRMLRVVTRIGIWLSGLSIVFLVSQLAGLPYRDWLFDILPESLHVTGFAISYPITYGSPIYKSNGWIMLEPSFMSFTLGVCLLTALLVRARVRVVLWIFLGILTTVAGSGFAVIGVGLVAMLLLRQGSLLRRYAVPGLIALVVAIPTAIGQVFLDRIGEFGQTNSSASMRSFEPYLFLIPRWVADPSGVWIGLGPGSSARAVEGSGVDGLIAPLVGKMIYDYGLVAGALLVALAVVPFLRAHERALAISLLAQFFIIQPPAQPIIVPAFLVVSFWAPAPWEYEEAGTEWEDESEPRSGSRRFRLPGVRR